MALNISLTGYISNLSPLCSSLKGVFLCVSVNNTHDMALIGERPKNCFKVLFFGDQATHLKKRLKVGMKVTCLNLSLIKKKQMTSSGEHFFEEFFVGGTIREHAAKIHRVIIPF